ncbi:DNA polymerase/3'-5' exonuclease PolX [Peptococcaceae bacterium 1198_IL3148]
MKNIEIAWVFNEMADLLEIKGADFFKVKAYRNGAKTIMRLEKPVAELVANGTFSKLPGIGKAITDKTKELLETGTCKAHQELLAEIPRGVLEIRALPGIGPKKARLIFEKLGIASLAELEVAANKREIRKLPGMSAKSEYDIARNINVFRNGTDKVILGFARDLGIELREFLLSLPGVKNVEFAGSTRRWKETVRDLDMVAATEDVPELIDALITHPKVTKVLEREENRVRVMTFWGVPVDLTVVTPDRFITTWHRSTGSKKHYQHLQRIAEQKNFQLSHKYIKDAAGQPLPVESEADIYQALGMTYVPAELREDNGEIEAAQQHALPNLVAVSDIKGDLHTHTHWSDAALSIEEMVAGAKERGYSYLAITDHSGSLKIANGLNVERLHKQGKEIDKLNEQQQDFTILKGVECDILADGSLDHHDDILRDLDVVVASVHSAFKQDKETMTNRIVSAIEHEHVDIIGHVSGRLLGRREGYELDIDRVLEAAAKYNTILEINASPDRLDLSEENARKAKEMGIRIAINTDAHDLKRLNEMEYGVSVARRAWLTKDDIINTKDVDQLLKELR